VVLDVSLPGLDGFAVLRRVRAAGLEGRIPVVLLTARAAEDEVVAGLELGAVDYVAKPFSPLVLMSRLERVLGP
jgi:DNA-binding response OmpR family regulator